MKLKKYLQETAKYLLRSYPVIRPYVKKVERLYQMTDEELHEYNEQRFLYIFRKAMVGRGILDYCLLLRNIMCQSVYL